MSKEELVKEEIVTVEVNNISFDKKLETKRLIIYLALSYSLAWIVFITFYATGHMWDGTSPRLESLVGLGMLAPLVAHVLTRLITHEGFAMTGKDSMMLGINLRGKKWIYFIMAMLLPWFYFEITKVLIIISKPSLWDSGYYKALGVDKGLVYVYPLIVIIQTAILSFAALGEEGGWRGYMMPKLIKLMGIKKAVLVGGIIWGVWHAPLTFIGHNFGTKYPGFPYLGIVLMCVLCTFMGIMLTYVTIKTGSIWPAAIMHAVNNGQPSMLGFFINGEKYNEAYADNLMGFVFMVIPIMLFGIIFYVKMVKSRE